MFHQIHLSQFSYKIVYFNNNEQITVWLMIILIQAGWRTTKQLAYTKYYDPQMYEREKTGAKYNPSMINYPNAHLMTRICHMIWNRRVWPSKPYVGNYISICSKCQKKTLILLIKVKESLVINTLVFWCGHTLNNISSDPEMWKFSLSNRRVGTHFVLALCLSLSFSSFSFSSFFHKSVVAKIWEMVPNLRNWFH